MPGTKGHIAMWIRNCVQLAYEAAGKSSDAPHITNAHEVRAVAHSLVALSGASLEEILEGGKWASSGSFFEHYYRHLNRPAAGSSSTPVVVGGRVLGL